ncbi:MAG: hypothetical protein WBV39_12125 [Rudaea sp.]
MRSVFALMFCCVAASVASAETKSAPFSYVRTSRHSVTTIHGLNYRLTMPARFHVVAAENRVDTFNSHPYRISLTAFLATDAAVMVHAETVADASGASNYDNLPTARLHGRRFHVRPDQCVDLAPAQLDGEHDLLWLSKNGFSPTGPLQLRQFLASSDDHNREIVISLLLRVADCAHVDVDIKGLRALQNELRLNAVHGLKVRWLKPGAAALDRSATSG